MSTPVPVLVQSSLAHLGRRVATARKARELSLRELAHQADVGLSTAVAIEAGHAGVSLGNLCKVLKAMDLLGAIDELLVPERDPAMAAFAMRRMPHTTRTTR